MFIKYRIPSLILPWPALLCLLPLALILSPVCHAYIVPAEQVVEFMAANFNCFETLVIHQITQQELPTSAEIGEDRVFRERLVMQTASNYYLETLEQTTDKLEGADHLFRQLLINNPREKPLAFLSRLGINLQQIFYTRLDGVVAYHIGDPKAESPKLLVEKKRFLPLLLVYRFPGDLQDRVVRVRFKDYRPVKEKWYPYDITYTVDGQFSERYMIQGLEANVAVDPNLFKTPRSAAPVTTPVPAKKLTPEEKERLKKIIEAFEKKYE